MSPTVIALTRPDGHTDPRDDIRAIAAAEQAAEEARYRRGTRRAIVIESSLLLALAAAVLIDAALTGSDRADVVGFSYSWAQAAIIAGFALTGLITARWTRAMSRVSVTKAVVFAGMVEFFGASHFTGPWSTGVTGMMLLALVSLAGMSEFILINARTFGTEPSSLPYSTGDPAATAALSAIAPTAQHEVSIEEAATGPTAQSATAPAPSDPPGPRQPAA